MSSLVQQDPLYTCNSRFYWSLIASAVVVAVTAGIAFDLYNKAGRQSVLQLSGILILWVVAMITLVYGIFSLISLRRRRNLAIEARAAATGLAGSLLATTSTAPAPRTQVNITTPPAPAQQLAVAGGAL